MKIAKRWMERRVLAALMLCAVAAAACDDGAGISGEKGEVGATRIAQKLKDDPATLAALKPSESDLKRLFEDSAVSAVQTYVEKMYTELKSVDLKEDPSGVHCYGSEEIKSWKNVSHLPGGYQRLGDKFKPGVEVCAFKSGGTSWDGLMWVDGKWFFIAKPFRAIAQNKE